MKRALLDIYHLFPPWARYLAAMGRGVYLRYWRYGRRTEDLVQEALERDRWSPDRWKKWQEQRLAYVLHRAATRVPYYRGFWSKRRPKGACAPWEYLENWEILDKEPVRQNPRAFVADDCRVWRMFPEQTSGTTGTPLVLWRSRETQRAWYALVEARTHRWHGISRHDRWAILGGQLIVPVNRRIPPFWVWNPALNQLYLSSFHLAPDLVSHYLDALRRYDVKYLLGYTSALHVVAQEVLRLGRRDLKMAVVLTNAEPVSSSQRSVISEAFQSPVRETYGLAEMVAAASECTHGRMHLWPEVGLVEVLDGHRPVKDGTLGELVCTGLLNADMPLIRYRVGDHAALGPENGIACGCGCSLPRLAGLEGRVDDLLYTRDGRRIGRLDPLFKGTLPILEAQIIQETLERIRVRYVPAPGFASSSANEIVRQLQAHLGPAEVILERVDQIPREANGKFRAVVCKLPFQECGTPRGTGIRDSERLQ